eukprot:Platyproteum_vivax@DN6381_c1_g1_i1.p1
MDPCKSTYTASLNDATCNCFDGLDADHPDPHAKNSQGKYLGSCLRLCWQNYTYNRFTSDAAADTCDENCVLNCYTYRFDGGGPTMKPTQPAKQGSVKVLRPPSQNM